MAVGTFLWVHDMLPRSRANGPGTRFTIWVRGCTLGCAGCFNPTTHPTTAGTAWPVADLAELVLAELPHVEGVTLSGGEPLEQPEAVAELCRLLRARSDLGTVVLTSFTKAEIEADPARRAAVEDADTVIAGRYNAALRLGTGLRGSANKVYWPRTGRYRAADFECTPDAEITIGPDGTLTVTGMHAAGELTSDAASRGA